MNEAYVYGGVNFKLNENVHILKSEAQESDDQMNIDKWKVAAYVTDIILYKI